MTDQIPDHMKVDDNYYKSFTQIDFENPPSHDDKEFVFEGVGELQDENGAVIGTTPYWSDRPHNTYQDNNHIDENESDEKVKITSNSRKTKTFIPADNPNNQSLVQKTPQEIVELLGGEEVAKKADPTMLANAQKLSENIVNISHILNPDDPKTIEQISNDIDLNQALVQSQETTQIKNIERLAQNIQTISSELKDDTVIKQVEDALIADLPKNDEVIHESLQPMDKSKININLNNKEKEEELVEVSPAQYLMGLAFKEKLTDYIVQDYESNYMKVIKATEKVIFDSMEKGQINDKALDSYLDILKNANNDLPNASQSTLDDIQKMRERFLQNPLAEEFIKEKHIQTNQDASNFKQEIGDEPKKAHDLEDLKESYRQRLRKMQETNTFDKINQDPVLKTIYDSQNQIIGASLSAKEKGEVSPTDFKRLDDSIKTLQAIDYKALDVSPDVAKFFEEQTAITQNSLSKKGNNELPLLIKEDDEKLFGDLQVDLGQTLSALFKKEPAAMLAR